MTEQNDHIDEGVTRENLLLQQLAGAEKEAYQAFTILYRHYYGVLYSYIHPFTGLSVSDTKEVIQEVFVKFWLKRDTLAGIRDLKPYLFRMARNSTVDLYRRRRRKQARELLLTDNSNNSTNDVEAASLLKEYHHLAQQAIAQLPERRKRIFLLRTAGDQSLDDISRQLGISRDVVKKQLYLAVDFVRKQVGRHIDLIFFLATVPFL